MCEISRFTHSLAERNQPM